MKLIYRASSFNYQPKEMPTYRQPRAINWRYQKPGQTYNEVTSKPVYHSPIAINWRYCINP